MVAPSKPCSAKTSPAALRILSRVFSSLTSGAAPRFSRTIMLTHLNRCLKQSSETFVLHDCLHFAHALGNCLPAALRPDTKNTGQPIYQLTCLLPLFRAATKLWPNFSFNPSTNDP